MNQEKWGKKEEEKRVQLMYKGKNILQAMMNRKWRETSLKI